MWLGRINACDCEQSGMVTECDHPAAHPNRYLLPKPVKAFRVCASVGIREGGLAVNDWHGGEFRPNGQILGHFNSDCLSAISINLKFEPPVSEWLQS